MIGEIKESEANCPVPRRKKAFDLAFGAGGIKRVVIECRSSVHRCSQCQHTFVPDRYDRLDKHFHRLKSWVMYQHVAHRVSLVAVGTMLEDFFGLRVLPTELLMLKTLMARYYQRTSQALLRRILAGNVFHIDETEVTLQTGNRHGRSDVNTNSRSHRDRHGTRSGLPRPVLRTPVRMPGHAPPGLLARKDRRARWPYRLSDPR